MINFIDRELSVSTDEIHYEAVFGDPRDFEGPHFAQTSYRLLFSPSTSLEDVLGQVVAESSSCSRIYYALFGANGTFAIDPDTGNAFSYDVVVLHRPNLSLH
jgi:hypothetical protein